MKPHGNQNPPDVPESELVSLWERLARDPEDAEAAEAIVRRFQPLVESQLSRARARLPQHVDAEEMQTAGLEALFLATRKYKKDLGVSFENYARKRIWGAMIDRLRGIDGVPRAARRASKLLSSAKLKFSQREGRTPGHEELAEEIGTTQADLSRLQRQAQIANPLSLDAVGHPGRGQSSSTILRAVTLPSATDENPLRKLTDGETRELLVQGLLTLPDRERAILVLYYNEGIMFTEIATAMDVSESRISQMHARALERLRRFILSPEARLKHEHNEQSE
jgi:RNA polymerase sigma factor for flagellar operon FliA